MPNNYAKEPHKKKWNPIPLQTKNERGMKKNIGHINKIEKEGTNEIKKIIESNHMFYIMNQIQS